MTDNKTQKQKQDDGKQAAVQPSLKRYFGLLWKIGLGLLLVFGLLAALTFWSKLSLKVYMTLEPLDFKETFEVNAGELTLDKELKIIPAQVFTGEQKKWQVFQTTGSVVEEGKAMGAITIFNESSTGVSLRAQTRFLSSEGAKIFKIGKKVYVPASKTDADGELIAGKIEAEVLAQEPGEDYNIGPSSFSIPGLVGSDLYYKMHAESTENMAGGFKKTSQEITEDDLKRAEEILKKEVRQAVKKVLLSDTSNQFVFLDEALLKEDFTAACFEKIGAIATEFNCEGEASIEWLGFKRTDAEEIALHFISSQLSSVEQALEDTLELSFEPEALLGDTPKMILNMNIKIGAYVPLNETIFLSRIAGEKQEEIQKTILQNYPQVRNIEMDFWPFWVKKAPSNIDNIDIQVEFVD